ncbi:MAG TPA: DNA polymerase domain-containing protein [Geobacteraceae bacterium]|nr:DNA polymerase domain-containing protein [Geobacteraceae bacterium]
MKLQPSTFDLFFMEEIRLEENLLLFGSDSTGGIVAAELAGRFIRLFIRDESGVRFRDDPFNPFILLETPSLLDGFSRPANLTPLQGSAEYRYLAVFRDWRDCLAAKDHLAEKSGKTQSDPAAPYLFFSDPVHQHLLITGKTLFKALDFSSLKRVALDIETYCADGFEFSNPERADDRIISIAIMDENGFQEVLFGHDMTEGEMLARLTAIIREHDPDVIEGHNLFRFDLEYIRIRAARHGIRLSWGRDGSEPRVRSSRFTIAERIIDYPRWDIYGRHVVDTYFLLQIYDISAREMESYGLKAAAIHFGLAAPDRVYLEGGQMNRVYGEEPDLLKKYNLDDVRETLALSRLLSYPFFLQTRIFPYSYQNCVIRGNATKINSLFLREYLRRSAAVPKPKEGVSFEGGYNNVFVTGVTGPIVHCDVASLYPSLLLTYGLAPEKEPLNLFLPLLGQLRGFRLEAKRLARTSSDPARRDYYQALQQTFKVLINSFYGYLGTTIHNFSDPALAAEVTRLGRDTIRQMLGWLEEKGARPVEVDTDGIYFIPPAGIGSAKEEEALVSELSRTLPAGLDVELDGRYRAIFSYKMKNYALLDYDDRITIKGSGLKSRGIEKYLREFMREMIRHLLLGEEEKAEDLYSTCIDRLRNHRYPIDWLAKTETLGESPAGYQAKVAKGKRNPSAAFEIALKSGHEYRAGDQISYYVSGRGKGVAAYENCRPVTEYDPASPDENTAYYIDKLAQMMKRFAPFLPREKSLFD